MVGCLVILWLAWCLLYGEIVRTEVGIRMGMEQREGEGRVGLCMSMNYYDIDGGARFAG